MHSCPYCLSRPLSSSTGSAKSGPEWRGNNPFGKLGLIQKVRLLLPQSSFHPSTRQCRPMTSFVRYTENSEAYKVKGVDRDFTPSPAPQHPMRADMNGSRGVTLLCTHPPCAVAALETICCTQCKIARYCQRAHQISVSRATIQDAHMLTSFQDIRRHRCECLGSPRRRGVEMHGISVLLFDANEASSRLTQVGCRLLKDGVVPDQDHHDMDWETHLGATPDCVIEHWPVDGTLHRFQSTRQHHPTWAQIYLAVLSDDTLPICRRPVNCCIAHLTEGRPKRWRGNVIGYRACEPKRIYTQFMDVSMDELPAFISFFRWCPPVLDSDFLRLERTSPFDHEIPKLVSSHIILEADSSIDLESPLSSGPPSQSDGTRFTLLPVSEAEYAAREREYIHSLIKEEFATQRTQLRQLLRDELGDQVWDAVIAAAIFITVGRWACSVGVPLMLRFSYVAMKVVIWVSLKVLMWSVRCVLTLLSYLLYFVVCCAVLAR